MKEKIREITDILELLRKMSIEEITGYDIKNQSEGFACNGGLKSICLYKLVDEEFDCDVTLFSMVCYLLAFDYLPKRIAYQKDSKNKYELKGEEFDFRGDTMNSYATTVHGFLRIYEHDEAKVRNFLNVSRGKYVTQYQYNGLKSDAHWEICILDNFNYFKDIFSSSAYDFLSRVHSIGNMIPCPFRNGASFNVNRGWNRKFNDYWDSTLVCIYNFFQDNDAEKIDPEEYTLNNLLKKSKTIDLTEEWLKKLGEWPVFLEQNFMQDYVDENGKPKSLWKGHIETRKGEPREVQECEEFFYNATELINKRGKRIAKKIKDKLEKMSNDELINMWM